jgi:TonB family protein
MIESEPNATSDNPPSSSNAPRAVSSSLIALLFVAAAFFASNWFFYQQGQRDAAVGNTEAVTAATHDAFTPPSSTVAQPAGTNDSSTMPATSDGSEPPGAAGDMPNPSAADAVNTGTLVVHPPSPAAKAKPVAKQRSVASVAKPSHPVVVKPENRDVVLLGSPKPTYPRQALREREEGTVLVLAQVDVQGHVSDARVIGRSGSFALDHAATNEVRRWQFQPALHDGKPVVASVQVPVSYRLEQ